MCYENDNNLGKTRLSTERMALSNSNASFRKQMFVSDKQPPIGNSFSPIS